MAHELGRDLITVAGVVEILSDDPDMVAALGELVDAFLPQP
jgi:hypothetical protein